MTLGTPSQAPSILALLLQQVPLLPPLVLFLLLLALQQLRVVLQLVLLSLQRLLRVLQLVPRLRSPFHII